MYNEELKQRYIKEKMATTTINKFLLPNLFEKSRPFEERLNKDLCNFTTREAENMLRTNDYASLDSIVVATSSYKLYVDWCITQGLVTDSQNHFNEFTWNRLATMINKEKVKLKVVTRDQLISWCEQLPNPRNQFVLLAIFEGIGGKDYREVWNIHRSDIDVDNCTIRLIDKGEVTFSKKLCYYALNSADEEYYYSMSAKMTKKVKFKESDLVIKEYPNTFRDDEFLKGRNIYSTAMRSFAYLDIDYLRPNDLRTSGIIHMINSEKERLGLTTDEYLQTHLTDVMSRYNIKELKPSMVKIRYGNYLK